MAKLENKWIQDGAVDENKFKSTNDSYVKGRNQADNADVDAYKINASDEIEFASIPVMPSTAPSTDGSVANKKYVDDQISALPSVPPVFEVQGNWNADTNTPALVSSTGTNNHLYIVTVAGSTSLDGEDSWQAGDWAYFANGVWNKADNVDAVNSVNSQTGVVVLDADDISDAATTNKFTTAADISKLSGIEPNATADQTDGEIKTAYENNANTNAFTDAEQTKLAGIESSATADQTGAEIKALYELEANAYTDAKDTKLAGIATGAEVNRTLDAVPTNGNTANSVSSDGVFDALALKADDADVIKKDGSVAYTSDQAMGSNKITGLADGTAAQDAVSKSQMEAAISASAGSLQGREVITLNGTDISNGYIELLHPAITDSLQITPAGGPPQIPGTDFTESIVVTNTRITFAGDLASTLADGDQLIANYEY